MEHNHQDKKHDNADEHHLTKKEKRAQDQVLREAYGDQVEQDSVGKYEAHKRDPKVKDDWESGEKRPFDRHSASGHQAYGTVPKKGGHGKGNVGSVDDEIEEVRQKMEEGTFGDDASPVATEEKLIEEAKAPEASKPEEIVLADQYVKEHKLDLPFVNK